MVQQGDANWTTARSTLLDAAADPARQVDVAELMAAVLGRLVFSPDFPRHFHFLQSRGVHVNPVRWDSPIPNTAELRPDVWERPSALAGIDLRVPSQLRLLKGFQRFREEYDSFPHQPTGRQGEFYFDNPMFSGTDALALYCMIRQFRPSTIIEVGSGFSTRILVDAAARNGDTRIVCIEPYPSLLLKEAALPVTLLEARAEEVPLSLYGSLRSGDVLFIDSSHIVRIGGDVNYLLLEVLPTLQPGVIVHVHDIFLPHEPPRTWTVDHMRFWSEQYLLQAFLAFNDAFEVLLSNAYLGRRHRGLMRQVFPNSPWWGGGSFWIRRHA
jgi:hypothetical protein